MDAMLGISHATPLTERQVLRLWCLWGDAPVDVYGKRIPDEDVRGRLASVMRELARPQARSGLALVPPWHERDEQSGRAPMYSLSLGHLAVMTLTIPQEWEGTSYNTEEAVLEVPAFRSRRNDATLVALDRDDPPRFLDAFHSDRFFDTCRRVTDALDASFAFGGPQEDFAEAEPDDPLHRAWGVTYYGPSLVARLGRDGLASAPVHRVAFDARGGCWVQLVPLPFVPSPEKDRTRRAVERHLRLDGLAPPGHPPRGDRAPG